MKSNKCYGHRLKLIDCMRARYITLAVLLRLIDVCWTTAVESVG